MGIPFIDKFTNFKDTITGLISSGQSSGGGDMAVDADYDSGWDRFINGMNRAGRPALLFGQFLMFPAAFFFPGQFTLAMHALALVPDPIWYIVTSIVLSWLAVRGISEIRKAGIAPQAPQALLQTCEPVSPPCSQGRFDNVDHEHPALDQCPAPNPSVEAWRQAHAS